MLEDKLWEKVRKGVGAKWRYQRIENSLNSDTPDVFFTIPYLGFRLSGMLELKQQDPNKSGGLTIRHYTQGQRDFASMHHSMLLLYSDGHYMLFDHTHAQDIGRGQTLQWHQHRALYSSITPNWSTVVATILNHLLNFAKH